MADAHGKRLPFSVVSSREVPMNTADHPSFCGLRAASTEVSERAPTFAVLPVGAHEQHGAHLPLSTDTIVASWAGEQVARRLGGLLLPTIPYGTSFTHRTFAGTVTLEWSTLAAVVGDVVANCYDHGVMTVFVMSGHGGNFILNPCIRSINARRREGQTVLVPESVFFGESMTADDFHAGRWETSLGLSLAGDDVRMDRAIDFVPSGVNRAELTNRPISQFTPTGVWGRATEATAEEGGRLLEEMRDRLCTYVSGWLDQLASERPQA
jgi:creatinine amidohydrolase